MATDNLYTNDSSPMGDDILEFDSTLKLLKRFGRTDKSIDSNDLYHDIAIDYEGNIYVADDVNNRIQKFKKVSVK